MQSLARELQVDIGFLFRRQGALNTGIAALKNSDPLLAEYSRQTRTWSERLLECRNAVEHEGWMLPRVTYARTGDAVEAHQPSISNEPVSEFVKEIFDRLMCFVEEVVAYCLQKRMPAGITITEIPVAERLAEAPERFKLTLAIGGMPAWQIAFHESLFEET